MHLFKETQIPHQEMIIVKNKKCVPQLLSRALYVVDYAYMNLDIICEKCQTDHDTVLPKRN